jgi:phosphatidylglycerol lysyltransferase
VGAAIVLVLVAVRRLMTPAPHDAPVPTDQQLDDAARIIATQHATSPMLVFLRDKSLLFNEARTAFLMYAVQGRSWVALGDPVGPPDTHVDLIRRFLERCDDFGGVPVFYEIGASGLHLYADFGLRFVKIGEAARVDLRKFTLENRAGYRHRQSLKRVEKAGAAFRVLEPEEVIERLPELRQVSEDWLAGRAAAEKGFSLGFFDEAYVARFPVAIVEREGHILAFANMWSGAGRGELSLDLMRHRSDAPSGIMESLVVHLMQWGQQHGYRHFVLGMAPLSGFEASPAASLWNRLGAFVYEYGEAIYNFQGLRAFKAKFHPDWEPHYLAYPGGLRLPRIMADVSALVAGGYRQIFRK